MRLSLLRFPLESLTKECLRINYWVRISFMKVIGAYDFDVTFVYF
jgi:hypothetical protein